MFVIEKKSNSIKNLKKKSFSEVGFKERAHLQEWIVSNPDALGEKLLIIQKEFNGFQDTNERLDLLALDKEGNLVIIENKLDDSGKDVTWQALKYTSYCSTLTKEEIRNIFQSYLDAQSSNKNAVEIIEDFFDGKEYIDIILNQRLTQRIILIAANFRKEVTSTVLWLMNYQIQLQCFKASIFELETQHILSLEQIIPTKDTQDYVISMTNKIQEERIVEQEIKHRHKIRLKFWAEFLHAIKGKSVLFQNSNPTKDHWLVAGNTGITYLTFNIVITKSDAAVQLNFGRTSQIENKTLFDALHKYKSKIEENFGEPLTWERMENKKSSRVSYYRNGFNYFNEEEWPEIISFIIEYLNKLEKCLKPNLLKIKTSIIPSKTKISKK